MILDCLPDPPDSFVTNCLIHCKPDADNCVLMVTEGGDAPELFVVQDGVILARLDGYAIIPMEEYTKLRTKASQNSV